MSEISLYPQGIDIFTTKVDETGNGNGDYIMAEHVNRIQNAITAIENTLGSNPQSDNINVTQRLYSLSKSKALSLPRLTLYQGNPKSVNGAANTQEAARYFNYFTGVLISGVDPYGIVMLDARDVIEEAGKIGTTYFYGTIDAGVTTANLSEQDIDSIIDRWKDIGAKGIYFKNFGYDFTVSRTRQNNLINLAHNYGMVVIVSASDIDHVFSTTNTSNMNPDGAEITLVKGDGFLSLGYAVQGDYYQNSAELQGLSSKMTSYRSATGVSMHSIGYMSTNDSDIVKRRKYYYGQAVAMAYSLDSFHAGPQTITDCTTYTYATLPIVGSYYDPAPVINVSGESISRITDIGGINVSMSTHTYGFPNIRIPLGFIDFDADDSTISAARLAGALSTNVTINMVERINADSSGLTIASDKLDYGGVDIINAINEAAAETVKISTQAIQDLSSADIESIVTEALDNALETELSSGTWDGNFRRLTSAFISGINAHFDEVTSEGGTFTGLKADILTAGHLNVGLFDAGTITSDKLSIISNAGLNKWAGVIVQKPLGAISEPGPVNVNGKDVWRTLEIKDAGSISTSDIIGSSATNYIAYWKTYVYCSENFTQTSTFRANSNACLYVNGARIVTAAPDTDYNYTLNFIVGWNYVEIYQDHNSETSCNFNVGIILSNYALQTETQPSSPTPIVRVDAYIHNATQISGDTIKSGSITVDRLEATVLSASNIRTGVLGADVSINVGSGVSINGDGTIKVTKDASQYVQLDATNGLTVEGGLLNINIKDGLADAVKINNNGIWAGNATNYVTLDGTGINIITAVDGGKSLELDAYGITSTYSTGNKVVFDGNGVRCIKDGNTLGAAITYEGIWGNLLTDQSVPGTKFDKTPPSVPTNVLVTESIEQTATSEFINLNVSWTAVEDIDADLAGYKIYLRENDNLYYPMASVGKDLTSYVIRNVKGGTQYYVAVSSYDVTGNESLRSTHYPILTTNDAVSPKDIDINNLLIVNGIKMFYIRWNAVTHNTDNTVCLDLDHYEVERYDGSTWTPVNKTYSTGIIDKDVSYDIYYEYRIRAVDTSGNTSQWVQKAAGTPSKVGAADIVAGSITAEVLNVGAMVKNINPNRTMLWHYDGVMTSTQDERPVSMSGGAWTEGKFGDAVALEESTINIISTLTSGNSNFKNGTTGWTVSGAEYKATGGVGGTDDGYVEVDSTNKISITTTGLTVNTAYTLSLYIKLSDFTQVTDLVVNKDGIQVIRNSARGDWARVIYSFTTGISETSSIFEFTSIDARKVCIDNIQLEQRNFATCYTESYLLDGGSRPEGKVQYTSERLNPKQGIISFWFKPNRNGRSPNTSGRILFMWGADGSDQIKLALDDTNKPVATIVGGGVTKTLTHQDAIDSANWNMVSFRYNCEPTTDSSVRYMDMFLNGTPIAEEARVDLSTLTAPDIQNVYWTLGNHNDGGYSANAYIDELKIDLAVNMDEMEYQEIISWYKQGSTFYDASSQIDADSQGISAANAKITINNEGITVRDGLMKVISDDGITLIGGGRINVNGMNVGVVQSDNEVYNGNFSAPDVYYGTGDMYLTSEGLIGYGAKYWRNKRSSAWTEDITLMNATWNKYLVSELFSTQEIYTRLFDTYNTSIRANELANHTIETAIFTAVYASGMVPVIMSPVDIGASTIIVSAIMWLPGQQLYVDSGAGRELLTIATVDPGTGSVTFTTPLTKAHSAGAFTMEKQLFDDMLSDELTRQINKSTEDKYEEWVNFGLSVQRYNDADGNVKYIGIRINSVTKELEYIPHTLNMWTGKFDLYIDPNTLLPVTYPATEELGVYGHTKFEVQPKDTQFGKTGYAKLGIITAHSDQTLDTSLQEVSLEQDLKNLVTYTDGLLPEDTNWKQHIFSFSAKWDNKPAGSQATLTFNVDELIPNYTIDENNVASIAPTFSISTSETATNQNDVIVGNTDFTTQKYQLAFGHASYPTSGDYTSYVLDSVRYASILPLLKVRYIRDWTDGSTVDTNNHWTEIIALDTTGTDVALGKTVTGSCAADGSHPYSVITDGTFSAYGQSSAQGAQWVQVDLGQVYSLGAITLSHYPADTRTYHSTRTQVSEDGIKWYDICVYNPLLTNSGYDYEYPESVQGWTIGGVTGATPNPILVEEIFTSLGETDEGKAHWVVNSDGADKGLDHAKYISSSSPGDAILSAFKGESITDSKIRVLNNPDGGLVNIYVDGVGVGQADVSFPIQQSKVLEYQDIPAGGHVAMLVSSGLPGFNTQTDTPKFMFDKLSMYDYKLISSDYSSSVVYEDVDDPAAWGKVTIKPNKSNTKASGTPLITASKVPVKYRVRIKLTKPDGDPYPCSVLVTDVQAELGENESFSRINYGVGGTPAYQIQEFNSQIPVSGITTKHLQVHNPIHVQETGIYERHIANYQITTQKIARGSITADTLAPGNITHDKLAFRPKQRLKTTVSLDAYEYPLEMTMVVDPQVRWIPEEIELGSETVFWNGQVLMPVDDENPNEDYSVEVLPIARHAVPVGARQTDDTQSFTGPESIFRLNNDRIGHVYTGGTTIPALTVERNLVGNETLALDPTFARSTSAYLSDGTEVAADAPRYEAGKFGKGILIGEGTTNLVANPLATVDLTGYGYYRVTAQRTNEQSLFGDYSILVTPQGDNGGAGAYYGTTVDTRIPVTVGTTYTFSYYARLKTGTVNARVTIEWKNSSGTVVQTVGGNSVLLNATWQRLQVTSTAPAEAATATVTMYTANNVTPSDTWYVTGLQFEAKAYPTSFAVGTCAAESLTIPTAGILNSQEGTIELWTKLNNDSEWATDREYGFFGTKRYNTNNGIYCYKGTGGFIRFSGYKDGVTLFYTTTNSVAELSGLVHLAFTWNVNTGAKIYVNGQLRGNLTQAFNSMDVHDYPLYIGSLPFSNRINGVIDDLRISNYARSDAEILAAYNSGAALPVDGYTTYKLSFNESLSLLTTLAYPSDYTISETPKGNSDAYYVDVALATPLARTEIITVRYLPETHYGNGATTEFTLEYGRLSYVYNGDMSIPRISVYKNGSTTALALGVDYTISETVTNGVHTAKVIPTTILAVGEYISIQYLYVDDEINGTKLTFNCNLSAEDKIWANYWIPVVSAASIGG